MRIKSKINYSIFEGLKISTSLITHHQTSLCPLVYYHLRLYLVLTRLGERGRDDEEEE